MSYGIRMLASGYSILYFKESSIKYSIFFLNHFYKGDKKNKFAMAEHEQPKSSLYYMANIECRLDSIETPALVALYRPLISRCVKVDDVVFYLDDVINTGNMSFLFEVRLRFS